MFCALECEFQFIQKLNFTLFLGQSLVLKEYSVGLKKKKGEKGSKNCLQSFTSFKGFQGGSCFMFTLQHADSSGNGFSFASWSISAEHKQGLFSN